MATSTEDFASELNELIQTCKDAEDGFREAAGQIKHPDLQALFADLSTQRGQFARELQEQVAALGQSPEKEGSVTASLHRRWIDLKSTITGKSDQAIIDECERGEDIALESYRVAIAKSFPASLKSLVDRQYAEVERAHEKLRNLKHGQESV